MPETVQAGEPAAEKTESQDVFQFIASYRREIAVVLLLIVGACAVVAYADHVQYQAEMRAWDAFFKLDEDTHGKAKSLAPELVKARDANADTRAAFYADMELIRCYCELGEYAQAQKAAEHFLEKYPTHYFAPQVRLSLGRVMMAQGEYGRAREILEEAGKSAGCAEPLTKLSAALCLYNLARADFAKDKDKYKEQLVRAQDELTDIANRRGEWPDQVVSCAAFYLTLTRDRLANPLVDLPEPDEIPAKKDAGADAGKDEGNDSAAEEGKADAAKPDADKADASKPESGKAGENPTDDKKKTGE